MSERGVKKCVHLIFSDVISFFPFRSSIQFRSVPIFSRSARAKFVVSFEYYAHDDDGSDDDTLAARCWVKTRVKQDRIQPSDNWDPWTVGNQTWFSTFHSIVAKIMFSSTKVQNCSRSDGKDGFRKQVSDDDGETRDSACQVPRHRRGACLTHLTCRLQGLRSHI